MKRYYIVVYVASLLGRQITGQINITTVDNEFINREAVTKNILDNAPEFTREVVITNIIPLTEDEYNFWKHTEEDQ